MFPDSDAKAEHKLNTIFVSGLLIHSIKVVQDLIPVLIGIADILVVYTLNFKSLQLSFLLRLLATAILVTKISDLVARF